MLPSSCCPPFVLKIMPPVHFLLRSTRISFLGNYNLKKKSEILNLKNSTFSEISIIKRAWVFLTNFSGLQFTEVWKETFLHVLLCPKKLSSLLTWHLGIINKGSSQWYFSPGKNYLLKSFIYCFLNYFDRRRLNIISRRLSLPWKDHSVSINLLWWRLSWCPWTDYTVTDFKSGASFCYI